MGGGQFKQVVKTIIEAERQPVKQMEARKGREEARLKLFQDFKTKFAGLNKSLVEVSSFSKFRELKADLGDGDKVVSVTLDKEVAQPGAYEIQVDQLAARSSMISNGFENPSDPVLGIGFIVLELSDGSTAELFVDEHDASLSGIASLINKEKSSPVQAAVIKDASQPDAPHKLIITAKKDGTENNITFPEFYFLDGVSDLYVDADREAKNAIIKMDGFPIEVASNQLKDFLPGINMQLRAAKPDQPFTLMITEDHAKISGKIKDVVEQVNGVLEFINKQNMVDQSTDTRTTFAGDTGMQTIEYRIRNLLHEGFPVGDPEAENFRLIFMNEIGVEFAKNGSVTFKEEKFTKSLEGDFDGIAQALSGDMGFFYQLKTVIDGYTKSSSGFLALREQGMKTRIKDIDKQIENKERILERRAQNLTDQFSRLQASLGQLQQQQAQLSAMGGGGGGGGNMVAQLMGG